MEHHWGVEHFTPTTPPPPLTIRPAPPPDPCSDIVFSGTSLFPQDSQVYFVAPSFSKSVRPVSHCLKVYTDPYAFPLLLYLHLHHFLLISFSPLSFSLSFLFCCTAHLMQQKCPSAVSSILQQPRQPDSRSNGGYA